MAQQAPQVPPALVLVLPLVEVAAALQTPLEARVADSLRDTMRFDALRCASTFLAMDNLLGTILEYWTILPTNEQNTAKCIER